MCSGISHLMKRDIWSLSSTVKLHKAKEKQQFQQTIYQLPRMSELRMMLSLRQHVLFKLSE